MSEEWINIPKWDRFYEKKGEIHSGKRRMTWVKLYFDLLTDDSYLELSPETRCLLHGIWMLFGSTHGKVPKSSRYLSGRLNQRVTKTQLDLLNRAGFIEFLGTKPEPLWFQNVSVEAEAEKEKEVRAVGSPPRDREQVPAIHTTRRENGTLGSEAMGYALRLISAIQDRHKDEGTGQVITSFVGKLPSAAFETVREKILEGRPRIANESAYAVAELGRMVEERQYAA